MGRPSVYGWTRSDLSRLFLGGRGHDTRDALSRPGDGALLEGGASADCLTGVDELIQELLPCRPGQELELPLEEAHALDEVSDCRRGIDRDPWDGGGDHLYLVEAGLGKAAPDLPWLVEVLVRGRAVAASQGEDGGEPLLEPGLVEGDPAGGKDGDRAARSRHAPHLPQHLGNVGEVEEEVTDRCVKLAVPKHGHLLRPSQDEADVPRPVLPGLDAGAREHARCWVETHDAPTWSDRFPEAALEGLRGHAAAAL